MDKPLSKLLILIVKKDIRSYEELYRYVHRYCGSTKMLAVTQYRDQLEEFFDIKNLAEKSCGFQESTERTSRKKRGLSGCSMVIERPLR